MSAPPDAAPDPNSPAPHAAPAAGAVAPDLQTGDVARDPGTAAPTSAVIAFFDVDNTLLRGASVYHLARGARRHGVLTIRDILRFAWHQRRFTKVGENGAHLVGVRERGLQLIEGHTEAELTAIAEEVYDGYIAPKLWPETVELAREHLRNGHQVWLITAAPLEIARVLAARLGFTGALGTRMEHVGGVFTGALDGEVLHGPEKAVAATTLATDAGADLTACWAYSDSRNDIPLLELVGHRVVVNPDAALFHHAKERAWSVMRLNPASIRAAQRRIRREAARPSRGGRRRPAASDSTLNRPTRAKRADSC